MAHPRLVRSLAAIATAGLLSAAAGAQPAALEQLAGRLLSAAPAGITPGDETLGHFELRSAGPGMDVWTRPDRLVLETSAGRLEARAVAAYASVNIDPFSGCPRIGGSDGSCSSDVFNPGVSPQDPAFLNPVVDPDCLTPSNALTDHSVNQTLFQLICASSIGLSSLDPSACSVFGSQNNLVTGSPSTNPVADATVAALLSNLLAGNPNAASIAAALGGAALPTTLVPLNTDPCDGLLADCGTAAQGTFPDAGSGEPGAVPGIDTPNGVFGAGDTPTLNLLLTQQQKALLGCGQFYGTNCEIDGIDLMSAEVTALLQSWVGIEGTSADWDTTDPSVVQPGTVGFVGGTPCQRFVAGQSVLLPGCRGPDDPGYDPAIDGLADLPLHPFTRQPFTSELAALSWNAMMTTVALSVPDGDGSIEIDEFDASDPFRTGGRSFARPAACSAMAAFWALTGLRNDVRAGGNGNFGRRDFVWGTGAEFEVELATGELAQFLGERIHSVGPEVSRVAGSNHGVGFLVQKQLASGELVQFSSYGAASACGNGEDDDGDGLVDMDDPGCPTPYAEPENPRCDDGIDNDGDGLLDFADPGCRPEFPYLEGSSCGLGVELTLLLLPWAWWRRRQSARLRLG
jgi:hypothetical protein